MASAAITNFTITSFRLAKAAANPFDSNAPALLAMTDSTSWFDILKNGKPPPHSSHPDFLSLCVMVLGAVLEVVCVSAPGYIVARRGMFGAEMQKGVANLNVQLFTPCLVFTKLASQLSADKLSDLAVIPVIFLVQTFVSFICSVTISKFFGFKRRGRNFVIAMAVFGNSNSLPISLVLSLSKTLSGLHWDKIPGDNDDEVAARGILYLLIFQQLGQLLRWTWGYNVLLKPAEKYIEEDNMEQGRYTDEPEEIDYNERDGLLVPEDDIEGRRSLDGSGTIVGGNSGTTTPKNVVHYSDSDTASFVSESSFRQNTDVMPTPANGNIVGNGPGNMSGHSNGYVDPDMTAKSGKVDPKEVRRLSYYTTKVTSSFSNFFKRIGASISRGGSSVFRALPQAIQKTLAFIWHYTSRFFLGLWEFMNPPLWAMLIAIIVASVPDLQAAFFTRGTFVNTSVTAAIRQSGNVAVPLILVVLGANLARNTIPQDQLLAEDPKTERNLLIASLISRMLLPTIIMAPLLALIAKYVPVSILDDPIFVIVAFLLTGAPTALQLAQICQINNVYMGAMSRILFQSYVIWILPSTLILVLLAMEVVEWAA